MNALQKAVLEKGKVLSSEVLKVDSFLNHQVDPVLMDEIGRDIASRFENTGITKVLTIEAGGIAPALMAAHFLHVPLVIAKKAVPSTMRDPLVGRVFSFTKQKESLVCLERQYLSKEDRILFVDDFLASGSAFEAVAQLVSSSGARLQATAFCIEKRWQKGRQRVMEHNVDIYSLADIASMDESAIEFVPNEKSN